MPAPRPVQHVTIAQSASVSGDIVLKGARAMGLSIPVLAPSCQLFMQGNFNSTSANFMRVMDTNGAGQFSIDAGLGSISAVVHDALFPFTHARVEASVIQNAVRSFAVVLE